MPLADPRFFESTRGRIVLLLRSASHTVDELAEALGLTDNGVRAHLLSLERDGLVRQQGVRRGESKPAYLYGLTSEAERLFPRPYDEVLEALLTTSEERVGAAGAESLMREVGHRLAARQPQPDSDLKGRLQAATALLNELGGLAELQEEDDYYRIAGLSCPLSGVVEKHPEVCKMIETMLSDLTESPVQECCERNGVCHCRFEVPRR